MVTILRVTCGLCVGFGQSSSEEPFQEHPAFFVDVLEKSPKHILVSLIVSSMILDTS
jgi:hypothetical protein